MIDHDSCALLITGHIDCWGLNQAGQLGDNRASGLVSNTPVAVNGITNAVAVSAGGEHSCAVLSMGSADCWGKNSEAQLGNGEVGGKSLVPGSRRP